MTAGLLAAAPTQAHLERLYYELAQVGAPAMGRQSEWPYAPSTKEELIALAGEMLRYDPRLLTILLQWTLEHWTELDPQRLRRHMHRMRWPQALGVVFTFACEADPDRELKLLAHYVNAGWPRIDPAEAFFFDAERPGSRMAGRKRGRNLKAYARWGFVGTERPLADVGTKRAVGSYDAVTRRRVLERLLSTERSLSLSRYLDAIDHAVSRQQAREDLHAAGLVPSGRGRTAEWRPKRSASRARG